MTVNAVAVPPNPVVPTIGGDPEIVIASLEQQMGDMQLASGRSRAEKLSTDRKASLEKAKESLRKAMEKEDEGGFFEELASKAKTIATVATVVAAAAAIGTGVGAPAGLALAAALCSAGSFAMKETGLDTKVTTLNIGGTKIDLNLSDCVALAGVGCGAAGAVASMSGSAAAGAQTAAETATKLEVACQAVQVGAQGTAVVATGAQAGFTLKAGEAQADAVEHHADSREATGRAEKSQSEIEEQIDLLRGAMETRRKVREAVSQMMEQRHDTLTRLMEVRA